MLDAYLSPVASAAWFSWSDLDTEPIVIKITPTEEQQGQFYSLEIGITEEIPKDEDPYSIANYI